MEKSTTCEIDTVWKRYDPFDPEQVPFEDGIYFALVESPSIPGAKSDYGIVKKKFCTRVTDLGPALYLKPASLLKEFRDFICEKYKYGIFTEPDLEVFPNYSQDLIIAFRVTPTNLITDDLVHKFVTIGEFDVALEETEDRLNQ